MSRFSWRQRAMTSICFVGLHATVAWTQPLSPSAAVFPLVIARGESVRRASCSLIARRDLPGFTLLYFATAARLFEARSGDAPITSVTIARSAGAVAVSPDDVIVATGVAADIGLLRAVVASERAPSDDQLRSTGGRRGIHDRAGAWQQPDLAGRRLHGRRGDQRRPCVRRRHRVRARRDAGCLPLRRGAPVSRSPRSRHVHRIGLGGRAALSGRVDTL